MNKPTFANLHKNAAFIALIAFSFAMGSVVSPQSPGDEFMSPVIIVITALMMGAAGYIFSLIFLIFKRAVAPKKAPYLAWLSTSVVNADNADKVIRLSLMVIMLVTILRFGASCIPLLLLPEQISSVLILKLISYIFLGVFAIYSKVKPSRYKAVVLIILSAGILLHDIYIRVFWGAPVYAFLESVMTFYFAKRYFLAMGIKNE